MSAVVNSGSATGSGRIAVDPENAVTPRQLEVLALVASGYSYSHIAQMKFYSTHTVQNHVAAAVRRVGARNSTHLVALLIEHRLLRRNPEGGEDYQPVQDLRIVEE